MDSSRTCPSCAAPAETRQRWCLECGAELPQGRRGGLRPAIGIATTLAVLVGAASAGGYTLLQHNRQPPPPTTTVAAAPPATTTAPPASSSPSFTQPPSSSSTFPSSAPTSLPKVSTPKLPKPVTTTTTPVKIGGGRLTSGTTTGGAGTTTTPPPQLALTNVALGAAAVVYAPNAAPNADLGDATRVVDGTTRTGWSMPKLTDPSAKPQIGIYVDLASKQKLRKLVIETSTPGIDVEIYGADQDPPAAITDPGWDHLGTRHDIGRKTTIGLPSHAHRYVLVWIVGLPAGATSAAISELSLLSLQPE